MAYPIDVGGLAIDRSSASTANRTTINLNNAAKLSGLITSVDVWAASNLTGFRVGIFYLVTGTTYRCRSSATIGAVTAGSKKTFPVSLPIQKGDFIGFYEGAGTVELDVPGTGSYAWTAGEAIDPGDSASYTVVNLRDLSLYGEGIVRGWSSK